ncbi:hypothetical protein CK203_114019 [Vitis vinifera]|uniref:Uncharacterized protein n=1 Tax=Vitis vinifera TaxID=29760 RepID=A0A438FF53_VITVI|nr:hypothetical protein CK203_114019 [Vitis vinifera]
MVLTADNQGRRTPERHAALDFLLPKEESEELHKNKHWKNLKIWEEEERGADANRHVAVKSIDSPVSAQLRQRGWTHFSKKKKEKKRTTIREADPVTDSAARWLRRSRRWVRRLHSCLGSEHVRRRRCARVSPGRAACRRVPLPDQFVGGLFFELWDSSRVRLRGVAGSGWLSDREAGEGVGIAKFV